MADTPPAPKKTFAGVTSRDENGVSIHSVGKVDLISVDAKTPGRYTCLRDFPQWGYKKGEVKHLSSADPDEVDEHLGITLAELVKSPELVKAVEKANKAADPVKV